MKMFKFYKNQEIPEFFGAFEDESNELKFSDAPSPLAV